MLLICIQLCSKITLRIKKNNSNRLALTQSFEIIFELGWKVLKDYLHTKDIDIFTPRDAIKSAFHANILPSAQV